MPRKYKRLTLSTDKENIMKWIDRKHIFRILAMRKYINHEQSLRTTLKAI